MQHDEGKVDREAKYCFYKAVATALEHGLHLQADAIVTMERMMYNKNIINVELRRLLPHLINLPQYITPDVKFHSVDIPAPRGASRLPPRNQKRCFIEEPL
eukprot:12475837-Heterocapsa_arctica.AAC.1